MEHHRGGRPRHPDILTPAEWRVLEELRRGGTNAEIAARLGIGAETVKSHVSSMLAKLELRSREELAAGRPDGRRGWLRAVFAAPAALAYVARPLVWVGLGTAAVAGVTVAVVAAVVALAVVLVVVPGDGNPSAVTTPQAITAQADGDCHVLARHVSVADDHSFPHSPSDRDPTTDTHARTDWPGDALRPVRPDR